MATSRQITASLLLQAEGYSPEGAAALVGNFSQESGKNLPSAFRTSHLDHGSNGLAQWRLERLTDYERYVRTLQPSANEHDVWLYYGRMAYQLKYVAIELARDYPSLDKKLREHGDVTTLTNDVCWEYERPNVSQSGIANRVAQAKSTLAAAPRAASKEAAVVLASNHASAQKSNASKAATTGAIGVLAAGATAHHMATSGAPWWAWVLFGLGSLLVGMVLAAVGVALHDKSVAEADLATAQSVAATAASPAAPAAQTSEVK